MSIEPKEFQDSSGLLGEHGALKARFDRDGFVFLRQAVDKQAVAAVYDNMVTVLRRNRWLSNDRLSLSPVRAATVEGETDYFDTYSQIQKCESLHRLPHTAELKRVMDAVFGGKNFPHPLSIARICFPHATEFSTPAHQDFPNNQGTTALHAAWIPLHDCPVSRGALQVLAGSHRLGLLPVEPMLGAGSVTSKLDDRHQTLEWHSSDMEAGDVLVFHSLTVHRSAPNTSNEFRLSADYRFQPVGADLTAGCLQPHFAQQSWDEIYESWEAKDLRYYWHQEDYNVVDFDPLLRSHSDNDSRDLVAEHLRFAKSQYDLAISRGWVPSEELENNVEILREIFTQNARP